MTTVVGILDKPALPWWYGQQAALCYEHDPLLSTMAFQERVKYAAGAGNRSRDEAASIGTRLHAYAEAHGRGVELPETSPDVAGMVANYAQFMDTFAPTVHHVEFVVVHRDLHFGGTGDAVMEVRHRTFGHRMLYVDVKSGGRKKGAVYAEHGLQAAALRHAETMLADGAEMPVPETDGAAILHIRPTFWELVEVDAGDEAWRAFRGLRQAYDWVSGFEKSECWGEGEASPDGEEDDLLAGTAL